MSVFDGALFPCRVTFPGCTAPTPDWKEWAPSCGRETSARKQTCRSWRSAAWSWTEWATLSIRVKRGLKERAHRTHVICLCTGESLHSWHWLPGLWEPGFSNTWAHTLRLQVIHTRTHKKHTPTYDMCGQYMNQGPTFGAIENNSIVTTSQCDWKEFYFILESQFIFIFGEFHSGIVINHKGFNFLLLHFYKLKCSLNDCLILLHVSKAIKDVSVASLKRGSWKMRVKLQTCFFPLQTRSVLWPGSADLSLSQRAAVCGAGVWVWFRWPCNYHGNAQLPCACLPYLALLLPAQRSREDLQTGETSYLLNTTLSGKPSLYWRSCWCFRGCCLPNCLVTWLRPAEPGSLRSHILGSRKFRTSRCGCRYAPTSRYTSDDIQNMQL